MIDEQSWYDAGLAQQNHPSQRAHGLAHPKRNQAEHEERSISSGLWQSWRCTTQRERQSRTYRLWRRSTSPPCARTCANRAAPRRTCGTARDSIRRRPAQPARAATAPPVRHAAARSARRAKQWPARAASSRASRPRGTARGMLALAGASAVMASLVESTRHVRARSQSGRGRRERGRRRFRFAARQREG